MKIKNLAFFGIMASILSIGGAHAGTTQEAIIASKAYVDAKDTATLTSANSYTNTEIQKLDGTVTDDAAATDKAVTVISQADGKITAKTGQLTSGVISDKVTTFTNFNATNDGTKLATASAIKDAIDAAAAAAVDIDEVTKNAGSNELVTSVTTENGSVTGVTSTLIKDANVDSDAAITTNKMGAITGYTKATTNAALAASDTLNAALGKLEKKADDNTTDIAKRTVTAGDNGNYSITDGTTTAAVYSVGTANTTFQAVSEKVQSASWNTNKTDDTKYPTVKAVEDRVAGLANAAEVDGSDVLTVVTYNTQGVVTGSEAAGVLATFAESGSAGVNGELFANLGCSDDNPCILSYTGTDNNGKAVYKWTPMVFTATTD